VIDMTAQLSQKERMLLQDQKKHEEVCIQKYNNYSNQAQDPQLKQLFKSYAGQEQNHYNTINQILNGQVPNIGQQQGQQSQAQGGMQNQALIPLKWSHKIQIQGYPDGTRINS
jgi:spore coat protein CotF